MNDFIAGFESQAEYHDPGLFYSDTPEAVTASYAVGPNTDLPYGAVVKLDGGVLAMAAQGDEPVGVLTAPVKTDASTSTTVAVYRTGHFRMQALVFDPSFTTDEQKLAAFDGMASPGQIFVTKGDNDSSTINI
jgi:hypothetical protein